MNACRCAVHTNRGATASAHLKVLSASPPSFSFPAPNTLLISRHVGRRLDARRRMGWAGGGRRLLGGMRAGAAKAKAENSTSTYLPSEVVTLRLSLCNQRRALVALQLHHRCDNVAADPRRCLAHPLTTKPGVR